MVGWLFGGGFFGGFFGACRVFAASAPALERRMDHSMPFGRWTFDGALWKMAVSSGPPGGVSALCGESSTKVAVLPEGFHGATGCCRATGVTAGVVQRIGPRGDSGKPDLVIASEGRSTLVEVQPTCGQRGCVCACVCVCVCVYTHYRVRQVRP